MAEGDVTSIGDSPGKLLASGCFKEEQTAVKPTCERSRESVMSPEVKAIVLLELTQKRHFNLEEHINDPGKYFPFLRRKKILSQAECCSIREQGCVVYQVQKLVELISLKENGYDVFVEALKSLRVNAHVAVHLKRRLSEVDRLYSQGE